MREPEKFSTMVKYIMFGICILFLTIGIIGYLAFGDENTKVGRHFVDGQYVCSHGIRLILGLGHLMRVGWADVYDTESASRISPSSHGPAGLLCCRTLHLSITAIPGYTGQLLVVVFRTLDLWSWWSHPK